MALAVQMGFAGAADLLAADLADAGARGPDAWLTGASGFLAMTESEHDLASGPAALGLTWQVQALSHKPFPSGRRAHPVIDGLHRLRARGDRRGRRPRGAAASAAAGSASGRPAAARGSDVEPCAALPAPRRRDHAALRHRRARRFHARAPDRRHDARARGQGAADPGRQPRPERGRAADGGGAARHDRARDRRAHARQPRESAPARGADREGGGLPDRRPCADAAPLVAAVGTIDAALDLGALLRAVPG